MSTDALPGLRSVRPSTRIDRSPAPVQGIDWLEHPACLAVLLGLFLIVGSVGHDLDSTSAPVGIAAQDRLAPFGHVMSGWEPSVLVGRYLPAWVLYRYMGEESTGWSGLVLWPGVVSVALVGLLVAVQARRLLGRGAGLLAVLAFCGSALWLELPAGMLAAATTGVWLVACLDRVLRKGSDWLSGVYAALAVLAGGWPALALVVVPILIMGRRGSYLSVGLLVPPLATFAAWSAWALKMAPAKVWAAALSAPLRQTNGLQDLAFVLIGLLPGLLLGLAALSGPLRSSWPAAARSWVLGWIQVGLCSGLLATFVPGFAPLGWFPLGVAAAVAATGVLKALLTSARAGTRTTYYLLAVTCLVNLAWTALVFPRLVYVAVTMGAYREFAVAAGLLGMAALGIAIVGAIERRRRWVVLSLALLALGLKVGHAGIYVPERDYRIGPGPWARAVGQWVPPSWPLYTVHRWPVDFAFHTGRPVRHIVSPTWLTLNESSVPRFLLLFDSEFEHWPADAPEISLIRKFQDERGDTRVLVRTSKENLPWITASELNRIEREAQGHDSL